MSRPGFDFRGRHLPADHHAKANREQAAGEIEESAE